MTDNGTIVYSTSTTVPQPSTTFHTTAETGTTDELPFYISFQVTFTFECDANAPDCPDLTEIQNAFNAILDTLQQDRSLNEDISYTPTTVTVDDTDTNTIVITSTIRTNDEDDFEELEEYVVSTGYTTALQGDLNDIDGLSVDEVASTITESGGNDGGGGDNDAWYEQWLDFGSYGIFNWVVIAVVAFFLCLCIAACSYWCCCRKKKEEYGFMNNPHRYDSEFPGTQELQSFSVGAAHHKGVSYVE